MKIANEEFTCKIFREHIRAYLDGELTENIKTYFLDHASQCAACNNTLKDMKRVLKVLSSLKPVTTTPEFDFQLKAKIRLEEVRLRVPLYRFKLFFNENVRYFLAVPALALVIFAAVFFYTDNRNPENMLSVADSQGGVALISEAENNADEIVYIYYVLETVQPTDNESGIFLNNQQSLNKYKQGIRPVNLISF